MDIVTTHPSEEARREIERMLVTLGRMDPPRFSKKHIRPMTFSKVKTPTPVQVKVAPQSTALPLFTDMVSPEDKRVQLNATIRENQTIIRQKVLAADADIMPRTQAQNRKAPYTTIEKERDFRSDVVNAQIRVWRRLLPNLIKKLSRIPDPRRTKSVKHTVTVLMVFGLFAYSGPHPLDSKAAALRYNFPRFSLARSAS